MARGVGGVGPVNIMKQMKGTHFPISKNDIVSHIEKGPGPDTDKILEIVRRLPDKEYNSPAEVMKEIGKIK